MIDGRRTCEDLLACDHRARDGGGDGLYLARGLAPMYERYFGLSTSPFTMSPNPQFLYLTPCHREALAGLTYGILSRKGVVVVIGEAGTGKTSLLTRVLQAVNANKSFICNPTTTAEEFLELAMRNFGFDEIPSSRAAKLSRFEKFLRASQDEGRICVLVIDEAQRLSPSVLEEVRLLTNLESPQGKLLQIILAGQTELRELLNRTDLRQLKQRIATRLTLMPLRGPEEVKAYVDYRWATAGGGESSPFTADAVAALTRYSTGIPRIVNALCDNALILAVADGVKSVSEIQVRTAAADLDWLDGGAAGKRPGPRADNVKPQENGAGKSAAITNTAWLTGRFPSLERYQPPPRNESWIRRFVRSTVSN